MYGTDALSKLATLVALVTLPIGCHEADRVDHSGFNAGDGSEAERQTYERRERRAEAGDLDQAYALIYHRDWVAGDRRAAVEGFKDIALKGNVKAAATLFKVYLDGDGVDADTAEAVRWLRVGARNGSERMAQDLAAYGGG